MNLKGAMQFSWVVVSRLCPAPRAGDTPPSVRSRKKQATARTTVRTASGPAARPRRQKTCGARGAWTAARPSASERVQDTLQNFPVTP